MRYVLVCFAYIMHAKLESKPFQSFDRLSPTITLQDLSSYTNHPLTHSPSIPPPPTFHQFNKQTVCHTLNEAHLRLDRLFIIRITCRREHLQ